MHLLRGAGPRLGRWTRALWRLRPGDGPVTATFHEDARQQALDRGVPRSGPWRFAMDFVPRPRAIIVASVALTTLMPTLATIVLLLSSSPKPTLGWDAVFITLGLLALGIPPAAIGMVVAGLLGGRNGARALLLPEPDIFHRSVVNFQYK